MQNRASAVPTLRTYKLQTLPRTISDHMADNVLSAIDRKTDVGRRDFAIIMLLYTYGIRAAQVRALTFKDINRAPTMTAKSNSWYILTNSCLPLHSKKTLSPLRVSINICKGSLTYIPEVREIESLWFDNFVSI